MSDWEQLQTEWQRAGQIAAADATQLIAKARRMQVAHRLIEGAIAGIAILVTAAALRHAGNPFEAALGMIVGIGIAGVWLQHGRLRSKEDSGLTGSSTKHLDVLAGVCRQQLRLARFLWIVLGLELVFLTPWWMIGNRVHRRTFIDPGSWMTVWLPLAGMIALFVWAWRLRRRAGAERAVIERLRVQFGEPAR